MKVILTHLLLFSSVFLIDVFAMNANEGDLEKIKQAVKNHISSKFSSVGTYKSARFGELDLKGNIVHRFKEKPQTKQSWINGGFFVFEPEFLRLIKSSSTVLEKEPLENLAKRKQLIAFKHEKFWQCMDTKRDKDNLTKIIKSKKIKF